ncbi:MAG: DUF465 domain-containing protein [Alphaproteobacteria bacterium]|nr:DUF465 domain-containing protein [Alphaproteobacteria bacterium]
MAFSREGDGENNGLSVVTSTGSGPAATPASSGQDKDASKLAELKQLHRDLDEAIIAMTDEGAHNQLELTRLKKRKLMLRDQISKLEDEIVPDIIA